jgi:hypothetical protein
VNPLILRSELPPEDAVVVIRGGEMNSTFVRKTAEDSFSLIGIFTISVALALDMSPEELCQKIAGSVDMERSDFLLLGDFVLLGSRFSRLSQGPTMTLCYRISTTTHSTG